MSQSIDKTVIEKTNAWPFVEAKKILKERKQYIEKKIKLFYKLDMGQAVYLTLVLLEKLPELQWLSMHSIS